MPAVTRLARLLVVLPSSRMGGTERHTMRLAAGIAAASGMAVEVATEPGLHAALSPLLAPGVALHRAALAGPERRAEEAARLLDALRPDAAFIPLPWPDAGTGLLPALAEARMPRLVLLHLAPPDPAVLPDLRLDGAVLAAVSAPVARRGAAAWGVAATRFATLDNPAPPPAVLDRAVIRVAVRAGLGLPPDAPLLLFIGRLERAKGADLLPAISARLPFTLACAGEGPLRPALEEAVSSDPRGLLRLLGGVANPAPLYCAADALVMPSRLEGSPLVFLEAAANRCPVVATPAALEALGPDASRLARIAEEPPGIADALAALLAEPGAAAPEVEAAAAHAARLTWEDTVARVLGMLRAAVLAAGRTG